MESYKFRLKDPQTKLTAAKQIETLVFLYFSYGYYETTSTGKKKYTPLKISTGLKIFPHLWNATKQQMKVNKLENYDEFNTDLDEFKEKVKIAYRVNPLASPKELKSIMMDSSAKAEGPKNLDEYIDKYINDIKTGARTTARSGKPFSIGVVKIFNTFKSVFNEFKKLQPKKNYDFVDIDMSFYKDYVSFLETKKHYKTNTKGKHIKSLKMIMKAAFNDGIHKETGFQHSGFKTLKDDEIEMMYLNDADIEEIRTVDLTDTPQYEASRDVFLAGCYTAQRYSDYHRICSKHIRKGFIHLKQVKTNTDVIIPIKSELKAILSKYNNNLPYVYEQKLNLDIKAIALKAKIENYSEITTHTARRSGATNMYKAKIQSIDIMKITGHKTEREFLKYIKQSKEETAEKLSRHPYFK